MERRDFIKTAGLVGAGASVATMGTAAYARTLFEDMPHGGKSVSRTTGAVRLPIPTTCLMCNAQCGVIGFLEDNNLIKIEGNPRDLNARGRICAAGIAGIQALYNPERILEPMRRSGRRGEEKWKKISWDEAIGEISTRLAELRKNNKSNQFVLLNNKDCIKPLTASFLKTLGNPVVSNYEEINNSAQNDIYRQSCGYDELIPDFGKTKFILNFGVNLFENYDYYVPALSRLADGMVTGMKLVTFAPHINNTSGKSSEWFSNNPGSELILALSMINVILKRGHYNAEFLNRWTDISVRDLVALTDRFTPELAQSVSGIRESHIRRIAVEFSTSKPSVALFADNYSLGKNATATALAVFILNVISGNIDTEGGLCIPRHIPEIESNFSEFERRSPITLFKDIAEQRHQIEFLMTAYSNPLFTLPNTESVETTLTNEKLIPFHVVIDNYLTETANYADIVLPGTNYLESWGLHSSPSLAFIPQVTLQQPNINPKGESRQLHRILIDISKRIGGDFRNKFTIDKLESYIRSKSEEVESNFGQQGGFDNLREIGIWSGLDVPEYRTFAGKGFKTSSGKIKLAELIKNIPTNAGVFLTEIYSETNEYDLILTSSSVQFNEYTAELMWLSEIEHENKIWLNRLTAEKLGIINGDQIKLVSNKNTVIGNARLTNGIHPKAVAMNKNLGHWKLGKIATNQRFESKNPNTAFIWWDDLPQQPHSVSLLDDVVYTPGKLTNNKNNKVRIEKV